jgi:hypothetical protein
MATAREPDRRGQGPQPTSPRVAENAPPPGYAPPPTPARTAPPAPRPARKPAPKPANRGAPRSVAPGKGRPKGISDEDWTLVQKYAKKYNLDPLILVAIGMHETKWGQLGDGRNGNVLGVGSYDSGSSYQWAGLENQLDKGGALLSRWGVHTIGDIMAGKASRWATDPGWEAGIARQYSALAGGKAVVPASTPAGRAGAGAGAGAGVGAGTGAGPGEGAAGVVPSSEVRKMTAADYGYIDAFLKLHPDIRNLVDQAVDNDWTKERLQAQVAATPWWRQHSDAQRKYDIAQAENPKELERQVALKFQDMRRIANNLGVNVGTKDLQAMARRAIQNGWSDNEVSLNLAHEFNVPLAGGQVGTSVGTAGQTIDQIQQMATSYGVPLTNTDLQKYTRQVLGGQMTVVGLTDYFRDQAKLLYPTLAGPLDQGFTTSQIATPYLNIAQQELGITDQQINLADSKWTVPFDDGTGKQMTADQWTRTLRNDTRYGWDRTPNARALAAQSTLDLGSLFGVIG